MSVWYKEINLGTIAPTEHFWDPSDPILLHVSYDEARDQLMFRFTHNNRDVSWIFVVGYLNKGLLGRETLVSMYAIHKLIGFAIGYGCDMQKVSTTNQFCLFVNEAMHREDPCDAVNFLNESCYAVDNGHRFMKPIEPEPRIPREVLRYIFDLFGSGASWEDIQDAKTAAPDETMFLSLLMAEESRDF